MNAVQPQQDHPLNAGQQREKGAKKPGLHRRVYDWVLSWAETRWGGTALFVLAFIESSFFPIPPDPLLIALALGRRAKSFFYAMLCSIASVLGGIAGYLIGFYLWVNVKGFFFRYVFSEEDFDTVAGFYDRYNFWMVFAAGFTPIPFKVFTITGGVCQIDFVIFTLAAFISRSARFFLVAWLIHRFGRPIRDFIEKYFNLLSIVFVALLVGGFLLIQYGSVLIGLLWRFSFELLWPFLF